MQVRLNVPVHLEIRRPHRPVARYLAAPGTWLTVARVRDRRALVTSPGRGGAWVDLSAIVGGDLEVTRREVHA